MTSLEHPSTIVTSNAGSGTGSKLPPNVLWSASLSAACATLLSVWCVVQQLRNYRKPILQRFVVRILIMVPIYSVSSTIALYSLDASFFIDLLRDIYEAFVIYCFFVLLVEYLGGERSLLILLHGRQPTPHPWPISKILPPMDISDPYTFLNLKRGILQYVQVKPILAIITVVFKATKTYNDGTLTSTSGYTYVSLAYNLSVSLCLYCLAMFWVCTSQDLQPFRPMPKFLCVKGIIFLTFWQGFGISILVAVGALKSSRYDTETLSVAIQDTLICFEMPLFALLHLYAFSHKDFIEQTLNYCGRLPFIHAFRDSILGFKDVLEDSLLTFTGAGFSYKTFEPAEGALHHHGVVRERRVRAGLRYSKGGKRKYWLPMTGETEEIAHGRNKAEAGAAASSSRLGAIIKRIVPSGDTSKVAAGYAPLLPDQAADMVHRDNDDPKTSEVHRQRLKDHQMDTVGRWDVRPVTAESSDSDEENSDLEDVGFGEPRAEEEDLYRDARRLEFGDYNNPVVDASKEEARALMRTLEEGMLANHPSAPSSRAKGKSRPLSTKRSLLHDDPPVDQVPSSGSFRKLPVAKSKLSILSVKRSHDSDAPDSDDGLPEGCVDLLVEDKTAEERNARWERLKGEANRWTGATPQKIFKVIHSELTPPVSSSSSLPACKPVSKPRPSVANAVVFDQESAVQATAIETSQIYKPKTETANQLGRSTASESNDDSPAEGRRNLNLSSSMVCNPWDEF